MGGTFVVELLEKVVGRRREAPQEAGAGLYWTRSETRERCHLEVNVAC